MEKNLSISEQIANISVGLSMKILMRERLKTRKYLCWTVWDVFYQGHRLKTRR